MLPLVQMHQMVPPPLDFLGPLHHQGHPKPDYPSHHHETHLSQSQPSRPYSSTPRAFAIRSTQHAPPLHRIKTSFTRLHGHAHDQAEHSLRRKTPSGTIDNGYDGSLTHLASGPPPLKHMIVPASSKIFPTAVIHRAPNQPVGMLQQPPAGPWQYSAPVPTANFDHGIEAMNSLSGTPNGWGLKAPNPALDLGVGEHLNFLQPIPQHNHHGTPGLQPLFGPGYQQSLSQTVYSPGSYQQPAVWRDGNFGYQTMIPLANNYTPQNSVDSAFMGPQSTIHHGLLNAPGLGQANHFGLPLPSHPLDDGFARYGPNHMAHYAANAGRNSMPMMPGAGQFVKGAAAGEPGSPTRFKERALQSAHKAYNDLLLHLTHAKKAHHGRSGSISRSSSKIMVYPKPSTSSSSNSGNKSQPSPAFPDPSAGYMQQMVQKEAAARMFTHNPHQRPYHEMGSPVLNAKASLDMLSTLCEQSGWKWVEGILLGGCLHYGLERYEEALEWFKRIVNLDPR
jgi:hypothetical protein